MVILSMSSLGELKLYIYIAGKAFNCVFFKKTTNIVKAFLPLFSCPWLSIY